MTLTVQWYTEVVVMVARCDMNINDYIETQQDIDELYEMLTITCGNDITKKLQGKEIIQLSLLKSAVLMDILELQDNTPEKDKLDLIDLMNMVAIVLISQLVKKHINPKTTLETLLQEYKEKDG
jgi:hypothetical protein